MNKSETAMADEGGITSRSNVDRYLVFTFGVIFVSVLLYLATVEKNPTPLAIRVYVTVLALAAAGVGAILPGFLNIQYKNFLRAGGALGLGVLVYLSEPTIGREVVTYVEPKSSPDQIVKDFLSAIDSGDPSQSWALLSETARSQLTNGEETWKQIYENVAMPLGKLVSRTLVGETKAESPPGAPPGLYRVFTYKSKFSNDAGVHFEVVVVRATGTESWDVYSYQISTTGVPG